VEDLSREALRRQFETNLFGTHELTVKLLPMMIKAKEGRIVQNSSVLGFAAMRYRGAYNASKFALEGLSDTLRLELEGTGVHVSIIEPGPIRSRFRANALKKFLENINIKKSRLSDIYEKKLKKLQSSEDTLFTLGPEAVAQALLHALGSPSPRIRYRITFPTHLFYWLKKILPDAAMDWIIRKVE
jgi:short-subunit dehydrogenase